MSTKAALLAALITVLIATANPIAGQNHTHGMAAVNGTNLFYEVAGRGRVVVLIHGGLVDSRLWDDQFADFARQFRVIRYDLRGFGKSAPPTGQFS